MISVVVLVHLTLLQQNGCSIPLFPFLVGPFAWLIIVLLWHIIMRIFPHQTLNCFTQLTSSRFSTIFCSERWKLKKKTLSVHVTSCPQIWKGFLTNVRYNVRVCRTTIYYFDLILYPRKLKTIWFVVLRITSTPELWEVSLINNTENVVEFECGPWKLKETNCDSISVHLMAKVAVLCHVVSSTLML